MGRLILKRGKLLAEYLKIDGSNTMCSDFANGGGASALHLLFMVFLCEIKFVRRHRNCWLPASEPIQNQECDWDFECIDKEAFNKFPNAFF